MSDVLESHVTNAFRSERRPARGYMPVSHTTDRRDKKKQTKTDRIATNWEKWTRRVTVRPTTPPLTEQSTDLLRNWLDDENHDLHKRARILAELTSRRTHGLLGWVAKSLSQPNIDARWRNELVFAAEHLDSDDEAERNTLADLLCGMAIQARDAANEGTCDALDSALRRFSALVARDRLDQLLNFLRAQDSLRTRQVALQCIQNAFESSPPSESLRVGRLMPLCDRVAQLAKKHLDPDWLVPGENSSLALNAYRAVVMVAHGSMEELTYQLMATKVPRLQRAVLQHLRRVFTTWKQAAIQDHEALRRVGVCLRRVDGAYGV